MAWNARRTYRRPPNPSITIRSSQGDETAIFEGRLKIGYLDGNRVIVLYTSYACLAGTFDHVREVPDIIEKWRSLSAVDKAATAL